MLDFLQSAITYVVPFVLVLSLVITIHELGHYWAARAFGTAIERFSIGFGKAILSRRDKRGVEWRVGWIPLGGYVKFAGDANAASVPDGDDLEHMRNWVIEHDGPEGLKKYIHFKPLWQRAIVVAAGPIANFILAIVLFAVLLATVGEVTQPARVTAVEAGSPGDRAGFLAGDVIKRMDGRRVESFDDVKRYVVMRAGVPIDFEVERAGAPLRINVTPARARETDPVSGEQEIGRIGLSPPPNNEYVRTRYNPIAAVGAGAYRTWDVLQTTVYYLGRLVRGQVSAEQLGGPIRIAQASGAVAKMGGEGAPDFGSWLIGASVSLLGLAAVLSVSVGFMNLLPIPVLDGGHLLFYAYEAVARAPLGGKAQAAGYRVGLALLLSFMLFATWNDLQRLRVFSFLGGLFS